MYRFFSGSVTYGHGITISPEFNVAKSKFRMSYSKAIRYYRSTSIRINNRHLLMSLLSGLQDIDGPEKSTYIVTERIKNKIASAFGITSEVSPGELHDRTFYTERCALLSVSFEPLTVVGGLEDIRAVRCLTHPGLSLQLVLPEIDKSVLPIGYSVVGIDIPLLAYQHKLWRVQQSKKPEALRDNLSQFISKYVLPGMIPEQIDISLRNRMVRYKQVGSIPPITRYTPIHIVHYDSEFDDGLRDLIKDLELKRTSINTAIIQLPMIFGNSYKDSIPGNITGLNVYTYWVTMLVFTDWLYGLLSVVATIDVTQHRGVKIMRSVLRYVQGSSSIRFIDRTIRTEFNYRYEAVQQYFN